MPKPIPMALRRSIIERYKKGEKISTLARNYNVNRGSIYSLIRRMEQTGNVEGLKPRYGKCGKPRPEESQFIFRAVRCMRTWHPNWGSEKIRAEMLRMRPGLALPHYRTFNRWFHWNGQITTAPKSTLPKQSPKRATRLHEIWQIDAKEEMTIADGSKNCWLNITDEYSGAVIDPPVFP